MQSSCKHWIGRALLVHTCTQMRQPAKCMLPPQHASRPLSNARRCGTDMTWARRRLLLHCCLVFAICASLTAATPSAASPEDAQLLQCYNTRAEESSASFQSFLQEQPPRLKLRRIWSSKRSSPLQLTVITAATLSRLAALELQCRSWPGPLVAAVYVPLPAAFSNVGTDVRTSAPGSDSSASSSANGNTDPEEHQQAIAEAVQAMQQLFDRVEATGSSTDACSLQLLMLSEHVLDPAIAALLPINALRNAALTAARTSLIALVDVDLLLSQTLAQELLDPTRFQELQEGCRKHQAWILPAFETPKKADMQEAQALVEKTVQGSKAQVQQLVLAGRLQPFASVFYPRGHNCTNFQHWYGASAGFAAQYTVNCEPWFIIDRLACPPYDSRFRGYGWNKVQQVASVNASSFTFHVHPTGFLVHRPHPRSEAQGLYAAATKGNKGVTGSVAAQIDESGVGDGGGGSRREGGARKGPGAGKLFHRKVAAMRHTALRDMLRGSYKVVLDPGSEDCRAKLSWWQQR